MSDLTTFTAELAEGVAGAQAAADAVGETQREQGEQVRRKEYFLVFPSARPVHHPTYSPFREGGDP